MTKQISMSVSVLAMAVLSISATAQASATDAADCNKESHYPLITKAELKNAVEHKSAMIVAYCGGPSCTAWKMAAKEACKQGYTNVRHFKEGIKGWNESK